MKLAWNVAVRAKAAGPAADARSAGAGELEQQIKLARGIAHPEFSEYEIGHRAPALGVECGRVRTNRGQWRQVAKLPTTTPGE
jgi:hypothetical protein